MVGGELSNNQDIKERRKKKMNYSEERRRKLQGASFINIVLILITRIASFSSDIFV